MYRALIIDNSVLSAAVISYRLDKGSFNVACCPNHTQLKQMLAEFRPHVVIYNIDMPQHAIAGHCEYIRRPGSFGGAKVIVISESDEVSLMEMVEEGFADGYFMKTVDMDGFSELVERLITGFSGRGTSTSGGGGGNPTHHIFQ